MVIIKLISFLISDSSFSNRVVRFHLPNISKVTHTGLDGNKKDKGWMGKGYGRGDDYKNIIYALRLSYKLTEIQYSR